MGPWTRHLVSVDIQCGDHHRVTAKATLLRTDDYPGRDLDTHFDQKAAIERVMRVDELVEWLTSVQDDVPGGHLAHLRIIPRGTLEQRAAIFALPWHGVVLGAIVSFGRGKAPARPRLTLPLQLSTTRDKAFLEGRLDSFVRSTHAWKIGTQGHVVLAAANDRLDNAIALRTRLVILETDTLVAPPTGTFSVLQIKAARSARTTFTQLLYRGLFHDAPLDAAIQEALKTANLRPTDIRLDLFEGDEQSLRLSGALHQAATTMKKAKPKNGGSAVEGLESFKTHPFDVGAESLSSHAKDLDFTNELHGANSSIDLLKSQAGAIDEAEATRAHDDEIELDRSAQLWIEDEASTLLPPETPLVRRDPYKVRFQIAAELRSGATTATLPNEHLRALFQKKAKLALDVVLFADPEKLQLGKHKLEVLLERWGATDIVETSLVPLVAGIHQVRACVYYKGNLLQSLTLQLGVEHAGAPMQVDYSGVETFAGLATLVDVDYSIWINDTASEHWIGVYSCATGNLGDIASCSLTKPPAALVNEAAPAVRKALALLEGDDGDPAASYRFSAADLPSDVATKRQNELFVELAREGRRMFVQLMQQPNTADQQYIADLAKRMKEPDRILSIARLDNQSSVPWALMYDYRIDPADPKLELCPRYRRDNGRFAESPALCRGQADCPLAAVETARKAVCPFGFWGFRHQIELRLRPADGGTSAIDRTRIEASEPPTAAAAMFKFPETEAHLTALQKIVTAGKALAERDAVLESLRKGDRSLYYFFCHAAEDKGVHLTIAPDHFIEPGSIAERYEADEDGWQVKEWDAQRPLVFLNACQSIALDAQLISPFLDKFLGIGASALVGTEVRVFTELAANVATALLTRMVTHREPIGKALLHVRRAMLGAGNPMGLAYSVYGSAALHFHASNCQCTPATSAPATPGGIE